MPSSSSLRTGSEETAGLCPLPLSLPLASIFQNFLSPVCFKHICAELGCTFELLYQSWKSRLDTSTLVRLPRGAILLAIKRCDSDSFWRQYEEYRLIRAVCKGGEDGHMKTDL